MHLHIERDYKEHYDRLFNHESYTSILQVKRGYALPHSLKKDTILFVGINPSFSEKLGAQPGSFFYGNDTAHPYFKKFGILAEKVDHPWSHLDLLALRETNQKSVEKLLKTETGKSFIWQQLLISKEILEETKPRVIIVSNTLARKFLGKDRFDGRNVWMDYQFEFDHEIGTDRIIDEDSALLGVPIFFTSMLTGQRALDNGSFERLCWRVKRSIEPRL